MKVRADQSFFPCNPASDPGYAGMPIRLELAARILAKMGIDEKTTESKAKQLAKVAIGCADVLIETYNETREL